MPPPGGSMRPPRHHFAHLTLSILLIGLWWPAQSQASVKQELKIRWFGEGPRPAQSGQEFVGQVELVAPEPGMVEGLEIVGQDWAPIGNIPTTFFMTAGQHRVIPFRMVPQDPSQPLAVRCIWNGVAVERSVRLDAGSLGKKQARYLDKEGPRTSGTRPNLSPEGGARTSDMQIHFMGSVRYIRPDGLHPGADNIVIKIWDEDHVSDELIWSGVTDTQGNFDVNVTWDDCDISGCDDPDIYLEIIAANGIVDVHEDNLLEATYSWETVPFDDFTGTEIDFQNVYPGEGQDGAIHIYNSIMRANRYSGQHAMSPGPIELFWPDSDGNASYDPDAEEIHVGSDR